MTKTIIFVILYREGEIAMKNFLVIFLVLLCTSVSAVAQPLTKADIQSLEAKITKLQETATDIDKRLTRLEVTVTEMDKRISAEFRTLHTTVVEMDKRLTNKITETDKRLSNQIAALDTFVRWAIGIFMLVVLAVTALPQIFGYLRDKKERGDLQKRVEQLEQESAQSKTRIIAP